MACAPIVGCGSSTPGAPTIDAATEDSGDAALVDSGDAATVDGGHAASNDGGDAAAVDAGDAGLTDGGDAAMADSTVCASGNVVPQFVTSNFTLTKACSPWSAPMPVLVGDATNHPVLTIEDGVTVQFASGAYLYIGQAQSGAAPGGLQASGTAGSPIALTSASANPTPGSWGGVYFGPSADATSTLTYATVQYGGQQFAPLLNTPIDLGSIYVDAGTASPPTDSPSLRILLSNLTVSHNGGSGIVFFGPYAGFAASSGTLTITDWATGGYPVIIDANAADSLPASLTTGASGHDGGVGIIAEDENVSSGGSDVLIHDETWPSIPIPYIYDSSLFNAAPVGQCGISIDGTASGTISLTIAAPNTIEFGKPCGIYVSTNMDGGRIIANGTASAPIMFTSAQAMPATGDWTGITVNADSTADFGTTTFAYCTFSYGAATTFGAPPGSSELYFDGFAACLPAGAGPGTAGPPVTNCTFTNYSGCAVDGLDLLNEGTTYGTSTTGTNGNTFTPASGNTAGVCTQTNC
jgi:hypothetical protein